MTPNDKPEVRGELPGPKAAEWIARDKRALSPSYTRDYPFVIGRGEGAWVWDVDGNKFLDVNAGIAVCAVGHAHPEMIEALTDQVANFLHYSGTDFYYGPEIELAELLTKHTPGDHEKRVFLSNSGAESIECAMKLVRYHTKRSRYVAFFDSFHGRTMGALSLTASKSVQRRHFSPLLPSVTHVPYGNCYRCPYGLQYPECDVHCVTAIEDQYFKKTCPPEEVAAIFVEPVQGEGGYVFPPEDYHKRLKELCEKYGILYVADEVQSGFGRTGKMFAIEHWGVVPDVITMAKGIASGMPLGATVASAEVMNWDPGSHGSTFGGNPVSCRAGITTIRLLNEGVLENSRRVGEKLGKGLAELAARHEPIGRAEGKGLMRVLEIVKDRKTKVPDPKLRDRILHECFRRGLLILGCGTSGIRFSPPLVLTEAQADLAVTIVDESINACLATAGQA